MITVNERLIVPPQQTIAQKKVITLAKTIPINPMQTEK